jgi:NADH:ubiquinone oxidoreductase subunit E
MAKDAGIADRFDFKATFCFEKCMSSPNVQVGDTIHGGITPDKAEEFFEQVIKPTIDEKANEEVEV